MARGLWEHDPVRALRLRRQRRHHRERSLAMARRVLRGPVHGVLRSELPMIQSRRCFMAHLRLRLFLTAMLIVSIATCAWACPPNAANSTAPSRVRLVNARAGVPDRSDGQFTVVIRDNANNPMPGASVTLDFSGVPDVVLCSDQLDPDMLMSCAAHTVRKFTNA